MRSNIDEASADIAAAIMAAEVAPSDWRVHFELGCAYLNHDMFSEAIAPLERARDLDGTQVAAHLNLSVALTNSGDGHAGEAAARAAIALDPSSRGYFCLGNALRQQGQPDAAATMFRKHLELNPLDTMARCNLGLALGHAGHHHDALGEFRTVLVDRPRDFKALHGASIALFKLGDYEGAVSMLRRACEVDATDTDVWLTLGSCFMRTERFEEALVAFEHVLVIDPDNVGGNYNRVATLINLGRASDALEHAERALNLGPEHRNLATLLEIARGRLNPTGSTQASSRPSKHP
jgi:tetratricopeptide (TPR) repeat protein